MSDEKALLAAIWEHPHEDTPRLMYADWLQENAQPERAEFIRVQCELARLDEWDDAERSKQLKAREAELWKHAREWQSKLKKEVRNAIFRRGFVYPHPLRLDGERFLKLKPRAFDAAPQWAITLRKLTQTFDAVFASPLLLRVDNLALEAVKHPYDQFERFADNERLRNVSELRMSGMQGMPDNLTAFLSGPASASLVQLNLGEIDAFRFAALRESRAAAQLRHLQFILFGKLPDAPLLDAKTFPQLRSLDLSENLLCYNRDESAMLELFFTNQPTTQLQCLNLNGCGMTNAGMEQFAAWPGLANLRWLNLDRNGISEAGFRTLVRSPFVGNLKYLKLDGWRLHHLPDVRAELEARFGDALDYYRLSTA